MRHISIDDASDFAINYALVVLERKVKPVLFDDFFRANGERLGKDSAHVEMLLSYQGMKGKYVFPLADYSECETIPEYTNNWSLAEDILGGVEIALTPIPTHVLGEKLRWSAYYTASGSKPNWYKSEGHSRISAMLKCYLKVKLGAEVKLEIPEDLN